MTLFQQAIDWLTTSANWQGPEGISARLAEHVAYSLLAMAIAAVIAIPLGLLLGHFNRGEVAILTAANSIRALPTFGLLTLLVIVSGIGLMPPIVALVVMAVPPMLVNTFEGIRTVDRTVVDAARGLGLGHRRVLFTVEAPVALPLIMLGARLAVIQVVSAATIAAYVGLGGLGRFIFDGLGRRDFPQVAGGATLAALVAILTEVAFVLAARACVSPGISRRSRFFALTTAAAIVPGYRRKAA